MKKLILAFVFSLLASGVGAQVATSLHENFDVACATSSGFATNWLKYNPLIATIPQGAWTCTPTQGKQTTSGSPTPGMMCTSVYITPPATSPSYHLDTSYLITPLLNLSSYSPGHVYLYFDSKVSNVNLGGKLDVVKSIDSQFHISNDTFITAAAFPIIGPGDSSAWVTHEIDITNYEGIGAFYIGFRYTGSATTGSTWYIDNVNTSSTRLFIPSTDPQRLPLTVVGTSTSSQITIAFSSPNAANYQLAIYDMLGREVRQEILNARGGFETYVINGLNLHAGMYFVKMGNERAFNVVKVIVQ